MDSTCREYVLIMRVIIDIYEDGALHDSFNGYFDDVLNEMCAEYDGQFLDMIDTAIGRLWADNHAKRTVEYENLTAEIRKH